MFTLWDVGTTMDAGRATLARIKALPLPPRSLGEGVLLSGGGKLYMDGSGGGRTAWLYDDWHVKSTEIDTGNQGYPAIDVDMYKQLVRMYHQAGIHVGTHAIGDRAIDTVVDTYAEVLKETPTHGLRHSIIHCEHPHRSRARHDGGAAEAVRRGISGVAGAVHVVDRRHVRGHVWVRSGGAIDSAEDDADGGIVWGGGSDYFVTPFAARYGIWASVARETLKGVYGAHPFGTAESVDAHVALRSYTEWSAHQLFLDGTVGSIELAKMRTSRCGIATCTRCRRAT